MDPGLMAFAVDEATGANRDVNCAQLAVSEQRCAELVTSVARELASLRRAGCVAVKPVDSPAARGIVAVGKRSIRVSRSSSVVSSMLLAAVAAGAACAQDEGRPDLEGVWTNSSITVLERSDPSLPLVLSPEQVKRMEAGRAAIEARANSRTNPDEGAPAAGGSIGGYNAFWLDRGERIGTVKGEARSSWITEPASGKIPFSAEGRERIAGIMKTRGEDGPEGMNPADRCLIGSRGSGGPPMLNNVYNNTYQIVQTDDHVVINVEMMHDARIVEIGGTHRPEPVRQWLGGSVGRWEGDTLVVTTRGWKKAQGDYEPIFLSDDATVTERFTRVGPEELLYQFEIDDPVFYSQVWKGEMTFFPSSGPVFEYACHEGNYALQHILSGARQIERKAGK